MLKDDRWAMELLIMRNNFPIMRPFSEGDRIGFRGTMRIGTKSVGTNYHVSVLASKSTYPQVEPRVYISPKPEEHQWIRSSSPAYCATSETLRGNRGRQRLRDASRRQSNT
jgi:hypothetical protein